MRLHLGDPKGILAIDETGFLKKGTASAGVARQYSGTAGRVENSQIGVFVTYAASAGRPFLDRELYIPKAWFDDPQRCQRAGIPEDRTMATKPELAADMVDRALDAGIQAEWTTGDAVYGNHTGLRHRLEARGMHYVLAMSKNHTITTAGQDGHQVTDRADEMVAGLDGRAWRLRTAGAGTKGDRLYSWARIRVTDTTQDGEHWLLPGAIATIPRIWHTSSATRHPASPCRSWLGLLVPAGPSKKPSKPPKAKPGWIITKCANTPAGTDISPYQCSPMLF